MRRHIVYALGLALALPCAGAWANDSQNGANGTGAGTELQTPAPANPNPAAQPDQAAPNAGQPNQAQPNPAAPNAAPLDQNQANPAPVNPAPPNQPPTPGQANPAPVNPAPPNAGQQNLVPPTPTPPSADQSNPPNGGQQGATPTYSSPLQEFMSHQVDEVGELSQELTQFQAANRPDAVMALYHMIRDHRLLADAAANVLARRGEAATPTITVMSIPNTPEEMIRQDIQGHQQTASNLQQMIANASAPEEKRIYQRALDATNQHLAWLQSMDQGQKVAVGFFGPTTPLGELTGATTVASAAGYPQPVVSRTAAFQQQFASNGSTGYGRRTSMRRSYRHRRYRHRRYSRSSRYSRTSSYR